MTAFLAKSTVSLSLRRPLISFSICTVGQGASPVSADGQSRPCIYFQRTGRGWLGVKMKGEKGEACFPDGPVDSLPCSSHACKHLASGRYRNEQEKKPSFRSVFLNLG